MKSVKKLREKAVEFRKLDIHKKAAYNAFQATPVKAGKVFDYREFKKYYIQHSLLNISDPKKGLEILLAEGYIKKHGRKYLITEIGLKKRRELIEMIKYGFLP